MKNLIRITREWAMPSPDTLSIKPIMQWSKSIIGEATVVVDPFARNCNLANYTNDLSPETSAEFHMDAEDFLIMLHTEKSILADVVIFDPPYSPRQISECYKSVGRKCSSKETQNAALYKRVRNAADIVLKPGGVVLSYGWNSVGMGVSRNYELFDMLIVCHGSAHNDTICIAERKIKKGE